MKKSLEERFIEFLDTLNGVENIDKLNMTQQQKNAKKADYFAQNRELIIELKSLETDTQPKVERILEPHRSRPEFPHFYGGWEVYKILKYLPDGEEINKEIIDAVTSSIQTIYRKANKQIRTTKSTFQLLNSQGLLIILNESIDVLAPEHIVYRLKQTANKKNPDKSYQYLEINYVLIISEAHFSPSPNNEMAFLILHQPINNITAFEYEKFVTFLTKKWTEFNNTPLYDLGELSSMKELKLRSVAHYKKDQEKLIPRHESYRRYYRRNPYFRSYDEKKMKWMFKMIITNLTFGLTKKATQKQKDRVIFWGEVFTHFLEEVTYRGMDMKIFTKDENTWKDIDAEMNSRFEDDN